MTYALLLLELFWEFLKIGVFAVGGGMATLPFLYDLGEKTAWYTSAQVLDMLAVSESTPGPIGINMATYVGYTVGGVPGAVLATLGTILPGIILVIVLARFLARFHDNRYVNAAFYGLRPASTGLIGAACVSVILEVLTGIEVVTPEAGILNSFALPGGWGSLVSWRGLALAAVLLVLTNGVKKVKDWHPIVFIGLSAVVGVAFGFAGV